MDELEEIILAYASTEHKAQGAEFPIVIFPLSESHIRNLNGNLLYTVVTRAKNILVLIASKKALQHAIDNIESKKGTQDLRSD